MPAIAALSLTLLLGACGGPSAAIPPAQPPDHTHTEYEVKKTDAEWRAELTDEQYRILRKKGTEMAFTGDYWDEKTAGTYVCAGCGQPLFSSETKFKSGTGWPSFWQPLDDGKVATDTDRAYGMTRTEALCSRCGGHLGHVFPDGPQPTGLRYCINSASLDLVPSDDAE